MMESKTFDFGSKLNSFFSNDDYLKTSWSSKSFRFNFLNFIHLEQWLWFHPSWRSRCNSQWQCYFNQWQIEIIWTVWIEIIFFYDAVCNFFWNRKRDLERWAWIINKSNYSIEDIAKDISGQKDWHPIQSLICYINERCIWEAQSSYICSMEQSTSVYFLW